MLTLIPYVTNKSTREDWPGQLLQLASVADSSNLTTVPYLNLQWNRSLFSDGTFEVLLDYEIYDRFGRGWKAFSVLGEEDTSPFINISNHYTPSLCDYVGHCEFGMILKTEITRSQSGSTVTLSGMMGDSLLNGIVHAGSYVAETPQGLYWATQRLIGNGSQARYGKSIIYRSQYVFQTFAEVDTGWTGGGPPAREPFKADYTPNITTSTTAAGTLRSVGEAHGCGLVSCMQANEDIPGLGRVPYVFWKDGVDRSIEGGSTMPVILGVAEGNIKSETASLDLSAGYFGGVTTFTAIREIGDVDAQGVTGHSTHVDYTLSTPLDTSKTSATDWTMGYRCYEDSAALNTDETKADRVASAQASMRDDASDYNWDTDITVDVSSMPASQVRKLGLGDFVSLHSAITDDYAKAQIVGINEICKNESHSVELVLGSRRWSNIQRSRMTN